MIEAYKITTELNIKGNANRLMKQFALLTQNANKHLKSLLATVKIFSKDFTRLAKDLQIINPEFRLLNRTFTTLNPKLDRTAANFTVISERIRSLIPEVASLRSELGGLGGGRIRMGGGIGRAAGAAEAGVGAGSFIAGAGGHHLLALGAAGIAGMSAVHGFGQLKTYEQNLNILRFQGFTGGQINRIRGITSATHTGFSSNDLLQSYVASLMATQSFKGAQALMMPLAQAEFTAKASYGGMSPKQMQDLARFAEIRGHGNLASMQKWLGVGAQMQALSGGTLNPSQQAQFMKYGFSAMGNITPEGYLALEPAMQVLGGSKLGTSFRTLNRSISGAMGSNVLTKATIDWWKGLGMWDAKAKGTKYGRMKSNMLQAFHENPVMWAKTYLIPALARQGLTSPEQIKTSLAHLPGTTANSIMVIVSQMPKELRTMATAHRLMGAGAMFGTSLNSPAGALNALTAAWNNFTQALIKTVAPIIIPTLNALTTSLNNISNPHKGVNNPASFLRPWDALPAVNLHIDGKKIAAVITKHQVGSLNSSGTQHSTSAFNSGIGQTPAPLGFTGLF